MHVFRYVVERFLLCTQHTRLLIRYPVAPDRRRLPKKKASLSAASHPSGESTNNARVKPVTSPRVDELPNKRIPLRPV